MAGIFLVFHLSLGADSGGLPIRKPLLSGVLFLLHRLQLRVEGVQSHIRPHHHDLQPHFKLARAFVLARHHQRAGQTQPRRRLPLLLEQPQRGQEARAQERDHGRGPLHIVADGDPRIHIHPSHRDGEQGLDGPSPLGLAVPHAVAEHQLCRLPNRSGPYIKGAETACFWLDEAWKKQLLSQRQFWG